MDLQEFAKRYTEKLIAIAAQSKDAPEYEAYRRAVRAWIPRLHPWTPGTPPT